MVGGHPSPLGPYRRVSHEGLPRGEGASPPYVTFFLYLMVGGGGSPPIAQGEGVRVPIKYKKKLKQKGG